MQRLLRPLVIAVAAAVLALAALPARAQSFSDTQRGEIERIIREYLVGHPEVLQEVINELEKRQSDADSAKHREGVKQYSQALFYSPRQVTIGNRQGDVTLVEFFDYNCGYCKRALSDLMAMMKADPKLKVVLKELPILGPGSLEAARVAVAVRMQDPSGAKYLDFHRRLLENRGANDKARALAAAKDAGLDMARLERDMTSEEVGKSLDESMKLAKALGINGTPGYVVGERVIVGAVGLATLKDNVAAVRARN